ncbi:dimethylaniline monooxygenase (N-oxide forming) [Lasiosphaeria hispida]|uniref:Dimethylaniline monooxygenase (N-oxide forming) n=1 Tax=Lasiosphaeria hispida TaxID=260671 RepID=A0AAJ0HC79_9PEZI|nr:dimethylaniline monooxygenase (N-oxide forming) [Lasiosphaeria hispida]
MSEAIQQSASSQRIEPGSVNLKATPWPESAKNLDADATAVAETIVKVLNEALASKRYDDLANIFLEDGFWRDHNALSWGLRTLQGRDAIRASMETQCNLTRINIDASSPLRNPQLANFAPAGTTMGFSFFIKLTTKHGLGRGVVRVAEQEDQYKIWTLFTTLEELTGHEEPLGSKRPNGVEHGGKPGRKNWLERREEDVDFVDKEPAVLIIGAGQGGLTAHARLKMLNVPTLIIDSNDAVGDNWRKRYHQLVLHDPVWYDHMPYLDFPDHWPIFTPKDKLADWFDAYAKMLDLNVWMRSKLLSSSWDDNQKQWNVTIERVRLDGKIETRTFHPKHIIQATGASGEMKLPTVPGMENFQGSLLCHSSEFPGVVRTETPKKVVVVGACNSAHDICQDYFEKGHSVTMVQRSSTCVISSDALLKILLFPLYSEGGPPAEDSDIWLWGWPSSVLKRIQTELTILQRKLDEPLLSGLARAGFALDAGPDEGGLFSKYLQRGGGYYIDVGTSQLIIDGKIAIKQGQEVTEIMARGVRFADGSELEADEIVFATGYDNMRTQARAIFGDELADRVGDIWGWDAEGEMRGIWTGSGHPGFWFHGGNLAMCRYFSRVLALQIKAKLEGLDG